MSEPAPPRTELPNRRPQDVRRVQLDDTTALFIGIGIHPVSKRPLEVFITGGKEGTDVQTLVQHVAIVISVALQHGVPVPAMARSLAAAERGAGWPAKLLPQVLATIQELSQSPTAEGAAS